MTKKVQIENFHFLPDDLASSAFEDLEITKEDLEMSKEDRKRDKKDASNWYFSASRLHSGWTPVPEQFAKEILQHNNPMPQRVRVFLADLIMEHLKPNPKRLADEILNHDALLPQSVRELLADFVLKHHQPDIDPDPKKRKQRQRVKIRRHDVHLHKSAIKEGRTAQTRGQLIEKKASEYNVVPKTIEADYDFKNQERKNKVKK